MTFVRLATTSCVVLMLRNPGKLMFGGAAPAVVLPLMTRFPHEKFGTRRMRVPSKNGTLASVRMSYA